MVLTLVFRDHLWHFLMRYTILFLTYVILMAYWLVLKVFFIYIRCDYSKLGVGNHCCGERLVTVH